MMSRRRASPRASEDAIVQSTSRGVEMRLPALDGSVRSSLPSDGV